MSNHTSLYNSLPSLSEANEKFVDRDQIFSEVAPLLVAYERKFGVCLVHRHCELYEGELMVATGDVTQPEPERDVQCYPHRWTAAGEPFEFTRDAAQPLPQSLLEEFQKIFYAQDVKVLGLFHVQDERFSRGIPTERTEGRKNILEYGDSGNPDAIIAEWTVGPGKDLILKGSCRCVQGASHFKVGC